MKKLLLLATLTILTTICTAQLRTNAGYDCDEELFPRFDRKSRTWGYVNVVGIWRVDPTFIKAERFSGKLAVVQQGAKFGLMNCEGRLVAPTVYDEIQNFVNGRGWARQGALWGLLDDKGKLVVPPAFEDIRPVAPRNELTWVKKKGVWGVFSKERIKMIVEPRYDACRSISDSLGIGLRSGYMDPIYLGTGQVIYDSCTRFTKASGNAYIFEYNGQTGLMEVSGTVLTRPEYDSIFTFKNYFIATKDKKWGILSLSGKPTTTVNYQSLLGSNGNLIAAKKSGKWGYILPNGQVYLPFDYNYALPERFGYYAIEKGITEPLWALKKTTEKLEDIDFKYKWIRFPEQKELAILSLQDSTYEFHNLRQEKRYPQHCNGYSWGDSIDFMTLCKGTSGNLDTCGFIDAGDFNRCLPMIYLGPTIHRGNNLAYAKTSSGWGLIHLDTKKVVVPHEFDFIDQMIGANLYTAKKGKSITVFTPQGKILFTTEAERLKYYKSNVYIFMKDEIQGLITTNQEVILKPTYEKFNPTGPPAEQAGLPLIGMKKKEWKLVAADGKPITSGYDTLFYAGNGFFAGRKENEYQFLDKTGREVTLERYQTIAPFSEGLILVRQAGKYVFLNRSLKPAFNQSFTSAQPFENGTARVDMGGRQVLINKQGKIVQLAL